MGDAEAEGAPAPEDAPKLRRRVLGRTGIEVTELALGTFGLAEQSYGPVEPGVFEAVVEAALDRGVRVFDMAPAWGDGRSEEVVGRVVGTRRDECVYVTRAGIERESGHVELWMDAKSLARSVERSLERLGTDRVDVLLLHDPPEEVLKTGDWAKALATLEREERIRAWGVSCATADRARMALSFGASVLSMPYNLLRPDDLEDVETEIESGNVGVFARSTLLHGLLTGRYEAAHRFDPGDHRSSRWSPAALEKRVAHVLAMRFLVQQGVSSLRSAALRFALSNPQVSSVTIGPRTASQLGELVADVGEPPYLAPELRERIPQVLAAVGAV